MNAFRGQHGFTMTETLVAFAITVSAMAVASGGWVFIERGEKINSVQAELDIDVRRTIERLKADLRLSARDVIVFYPEGPGPYTAISFPIARANSDDGLIELDAEGRIVWNQTLIYHVRESTPNRLLLTTFDPRDNSLTDAQRQEQLNQVVAAGHGRSTYNGAHAKTRVLFQNLFTWKITKSGIVFDAYHPVLERELNVGLGSVLLGPGDHTFQFIAVDKNPANTSGYRKIGLDTLTVSPSAIEREAEHQLPVTEESGAKTKADYLPEGAWSGNCQLLFPATASNQFFTLTMENDRWEETNFRGTGSYGEQTVVQFDDALSPPQFVVELKGPETVWRAQDQTKTNDDHDSQNSLSGAAVRVLVHGKQMAGEGGSIERSGKSLYVLFGASDDGDMEIAAAYIAEAESHTDFTPNATATGRVEQLRFLPSHLALGTSEPLSLLDSLYNQPNATIKAGRRVWARPKAPFPIDAEKSYLISFLVSSAPGKGNGIYWIESRAGTPGAYVISNGTVAVAQAANWSGENVEMRQNLYSVCEVYALCPTNGLFTSHIVDTHQEEPAYSEVHFGATLNGGSVGMKVRTGNQPDLSDASAWSNVSARTSSDSINPGDNRYVQFQAVLNPDNTGWKTPKLKKVAVRWAGVSRIVDLAATVTKGPDYGIWEVKVDGQSPVKGVTVDLTIYKDVSAFGGKSTRLTSSMVTEIEPRNTGR